MRVDRRRPAGRLRWTDIGFLAQLKESFHPSQGGWGRAWIAEDRLLRLRNYHHCASRLNPQQPHWGFMVNEMNVPIDLDNAFRV